MGLGVEITPDPDINVGRKQLRAHDGKFYLEHDEFYSEISAFKSMGSATSHIVYTVPTGKKFHLRSVVIYGGVKKTTLSFYSSSVTTSTRKLKIRMSSTGTALATYTATGLQGFCFTTYVKVAVSSVGTGTGVAIGGILDSQPDV